MFAICKKVFGSQLCTRQTRVNPESNVGWANAGPTYIAIWEGIVTRTKMANNVLKGVWGDVSALFQIPLKFVFGF